MQHILKNNQGMDYNSGDANLYSWYYDTQALYNYGEPIGHLGTAGWNPCLSMPNLRTVVGPRKGTEKLHRKGSRMREIYRTTLCTLMLEVYYRYVY